MGILDAIKSALGFGGGAGGEAGDRDAMYLYVRCSRCGDVVRVRVNLANEPAQEFDESGDKVTGYTLNKTIIDSKCFRPIPVTVRFDPRRRELEREIEGGEFVGREEYEAAQAERARPTGDGSDAGTT
ncbi:MAG: hypothetical protein M3O34_10045 [Chloroflexota bacterium]|nr:hypothetical protein [Chloroflexota bacterium]